MKILAIETSCDETGVAVVEGRLLGKIRSHPKNKTRQIGSRSRPQAQSQIQPQIRLLGNALFSQTKLHAKYGGVVPMLAKREHGKILPHLLIEAMSQAKIYKEKKQIDKKTLREMPKIEKLLEQNLDLWESFQKTCLKISAPKISAIAVTIGPGLPPALWAGINFAKSLGKIWQIPVVGINHLEGHIFISLLTKKDDAKNSPDWQKLAFKNPTGLALLVSGGHTELVLCQNGKYKIIGQTKDDAAGEAFDKVARMLSLPYPGGPEISKLAKEARLGKPTQTIALPRPMLHSPDFDFSFSGLKTAVFYTLKKHPLPLTEDFKRSIALEFENACVEVLVHKTIKALQKFGAKVCILGGGVAANDYLRESLAKAMTNLDPKIKLILPEKSFTTDNAFMIGVAAFGRLTKSGHVPKKIRGDNEQKLTADGRLSL